jgi:hypothetical protein
MGNALPITGKPVHTFTVAVPSRELRRDPVSEKCRAGSTESIESGYKGLYDIHFRNLPATRRRAGRLRGEASAAWKRMK